MPVVVVLGVTKKMSSRKGVAEMPQVRVIQPISEQAKKLRVAAYARVSSDSADQLNSFATQVAYYTDFIQSKDEWEFAGLYADEAGFPAPQSTSGTISNACLPTAVLGK